MLVLEVERPVGQLDGALEPFQLQRVDETVGAYPIDEPVLAVEVGQHLKKIEVLFLVIYP